MKSSNLIKEELKKSELDAHMTKVMSSKDFKDAVTKIIKDRVKNDSALEDRVVEISKNVLTQLFKTLWVKRQTWSGGLSNKSS